MRQVILCKRKSKLKKAFTSIKTHFPHDVDARYFQYKLYVCLLQNFMITLKIN
jgi:hypothetical protein